MEASQPPLPGSRSDLAVWKRKMLPSLQRESEILWFKARETSTPREREKERERAEGDRCRDEG